MPTSKVRSRRACGTKKGLKGISRIKEASNECQFLGDTVISPEGRDMLQTLQQEDAVRDSGERSAVTAMGASIKEFVGKYFRKTPNVSQVINGKNTLDSNQNKIEWCITNYFQTSDSLQIEDLFLGGGSDETIGGRLLLEPRLSSSPCLSPQVRGSAIFEERLPLCIALEKEKEGFEEGDRVASNMGTPSPSGRQSVLALDTTAVSAESLLEVMFLMQKTLQAIVEVMTANNGLGKVHKNKLQGITEELK
ncbi:hypothetical protein NDU88_001311 [Pleurodeles waltl]|uniref:Uncharacterized protein n=1 Tax=Pleurodeles waltl TaxID=8319 RepID=A0AAV7MJC7_PLEWA|nr:hypothetical protein NDU88_001311 [Pleurodeles waltl]